MVKVSLGLLAFAVMVQPLFAEAGLMQNWLARDDRRTRRIGRLRRGFQGVDGCDSDDGVLLCMKLPDLGDGVCNAADLQRILTTIKQPGFHGDKVHIIRSESPSGWLNVPALQPAKPLVGPPSSAWQTLHSSGVYMLEDFLSATEADAIVAQIQSRDPISSEVTQPALPTCGFRRSTTWVLFGSQRQQAPMPSDLLARMEAATNVPMKHYEPSQVVEYHPGDFFSDHYDSSVCDHIGSHQLPELHDVKLRESIDCGEGMRRQGTFIVYLTDESSSTGGATYFPKLDVRVQPKKGRALFFRPTRPDGSVDPWMLHSAETQLGGRKFLLQQWMMRGTGW